MTYTCNHCQQSAEFDTDFPDPIPCGVCGQGTLIEEEKYRTDYCYTRQDVSMMMLDRGDELERLREENERLKKERDDYENREALCCPEDIGFDEYIRHLESKIEALNAEQGVT